MKHRIFILVLIPELLLGVITHAQMVPAPLSLAASPSSPSPGAMVTVQAATPTFDKDRAFFAWTVDGKARPDFSGNGKNEIRLAAGDIGSQIRVSVSVSPSEGDGGDASLMIRVSGLSLTYVAQTLIPRWYRGKALPTTNSIVDIIAIPEFVINGTRVAPENLIYHWSMDDQTNALTGAGKQVFQIRTSDLPGISHQVDVTIEDTDRKIHKEGRMIIEPGDPRVVIYPSTPLGGIESRSANGAALQKRGLVDVAGEAFYFPATSRQNLAWSWDLGGTPVSPSAGPALATIDTSSLQQGTTPLTLRVSYAKGLIPQSASKVLNLFFQ